MSEVNIESATVNILIELDGQVHLVAMEKDALETINFLIKRATKETIKTGKTQIELQEFLGYKG